MNQTLMLHLKTTRGVVDATKLVLFCFLKYFFIENILK